MSKRRILYQFENHIPTCQPMCVAAVNSANKQMFYRQEELPGVYLWDTDGLDAVAVFDDLGMRAVKQLRKIRSIFLHEDNK